MDVFISYEHSDRERAKSIAAALEQQGWSVWWDRKLRGGQHFDQVIQKELNAARCVIVLWSHRSVLSDWVKDEASEGSQRGILVPVRIDDVPIPLGFRRLHTIDLFTSGVPLTDVAALDDLAQSIRHVLSPSDTSRADHSDRVTTSATRTRRWHVRPQHIVFLAIGLVLFGFGVTALIYPGFPWVRSGSPASSQATAAPAPESTIAPDNPILATPICVVQLAIPGVDATLRQRRLADGRVESFWMFGWRDCPEATRYHLYVIGPGALNPVVDDDSITATRFTHRALHTGITRREGWSWKVRAYVGGRWAPWSEERKFNVAALPTPGSGRAGSAPPAPDDIPSSGQAAYDAVQALYGRGRGEKECVVLRRIVDQMRAYSKHDALVPEKAANTILYPSKIPQPRISDLVTDRVTRLRAIHASCF
jgi:hypothetical protein